MSVLKPHYKASFVLTQYILDSSKIKTEFRFQRGFKRTSKQRKRVAIIGKKNRIINKRLLLKG